MLALKIIGGIVAIAVAIPVAMFVYFFVQATDEIRGCTRIQPTTINPEKVAYQCPDGVRWIRQRNPY